MPKYYSLKGVPWQYKGVANVEDCISAEEVMTKSGLDFHVDKCELYAKMPIINNGNDEELDAVSETLKNNNDAHLYGKDVYRNCPNAYGTYRTDYNIPLGIVKSKYTVVQNSEAFKFFNDAIVNGGVKWQTAGAFGKGERIFVSAKLPGAYMVGSKDPIEDYLVFTNTHDGSGGVKILFTPIRVICQNTLNAAIRTSTNFISFRHTASVHSNIQLAHSILGICKSRRIEFEEECNKLYKTAITDEQCMEYIVSNILSNDEWEKLNQTRHTPKELCYRNNLAYEDSEISMKKLNVISDTWEYYNNGIGQKEIIGTAWGAVNAITGYYSNVDNGFGEKFMDSILYGDKSKKIQTAFAMAETFN